MELISNIKVDKNKLFSNFKNIKNIGNFQMLSCIKLFFFKNKIFNNMANYMLILLLILSNISLLVFSIYDSKKIKKLIDIIIKVGKFKFKNKIIKKTNKIKNIIRKKNKKRDKKKIKNKNRISNQVTSENSYNYINGSMQNTESLTNIYLKILEFNDFELNGLSYKNALTNDKRTFFQIYWSLLKREHLIIFTFFSWNNFNLIYIKLTRFVFLIANDMALNVFFFSDESMHKLYVNYGKYDFIQQIPQIVYSTIISRLLEIFLCFLSLTDKHMYQLKDTIINNSFKSKNLNYIYKYMTMKLIGFYVFSCIMLLLYWYVVSSFCAVYQNTQISFIKDCILSFLLLLVFLD